ncbi:neurofilament heavy polypeptide-like [Phlebotomus papatasi]|uniref:neurofilament heavy polypeptide-like n=1 Tax=Phlebotomus papatasi TaxID=29031 RepID=UPI002484732B|nr:neurofilament heavy polypeptide-like [Phlebotomus papatasi]
MPLPAFRDAFPQKAFLEPLDVMSMEVFIDQGNAVETVEDSMVLDDFPMQEINIQASDFDFLDNLPEPTLEGPKNPPEATLDKSDEAQSPIYVTIPSISEKEKPVEASEVSVIENPGKEHNYAFPKPIITMRPLQTVAKIVQEKVPEKILEDEFAELAKAVISLPTLFPRKPKLRERKQKLVFRIEDEDPGTPKKKIDINRARKQLFPAEEESPQLQKTDEEEGKENKIVEKIKKKMPKKQKKKEDSFKTPEIQKSPEDFQETLVETRRSLRLNTSSNEQKIKEIYLSCDLCQKIFKDKRILIYHRKAHSK